MSEVRLTAKQLIQFVDAVIDTICQSEVTLLSDINVVDDHSLREFIEWDFCANCPGKELVGRCGVREVLEALGGRCDYAEMP
jgi:hypothetical protein